MATESGINWLGDCFRRRASIVFGAVLLSLGLAAHMMVNSLASGYATSWGSIARPELVRVSLIVRGNGEQLPLPHIHYHEYSQLKIFERLEAAEVDEMNVERNGEIEVQTVSQLTPGYLELLNVPLLAGRFPQDPDEAIVSYAFWKRTQSGDRQFGDAFYLGVAGRQVQIVGVLKRDVVLPESSELKSEIFLRRGLSELPPRSLAEDRPRFFAVGRLRYDATIEQSLNVLEKVAPGKGTAGEDMLRHLVPNVSTLSAQVDGQYTRRVNRLIAVCRIAGFGIFVSSCLTVAGMMMGNVARRMPDSALRVSMGATPLRIAMSDCVEAVFIVVLGVTLAYPVAFIMARSLAGNLPGLTLTGGIRIPILAGVVLPGVAALGVLAAASVSTYDRRLFRDPYLLLRSSSGVSFTSSRGGLRALISVFQAALAMVLLNGSMLLIQTVSNSRAAPQGCAPEGKVIIEIRNKSEPVPTTDLPRQILTRAKESAGVDAVAVGPQLLGRVLWIPAVMTRFSSGNNIASGEEFDIPGTPILGDFPKALGGKVIAGVGLEDGQTGVIVNRTLAVRYFGSPEAACGKMLVRVGVGVWTVVGVMEDINPMKGSETPHYYYSAAPSSDWFREFQVVLSTKDSWQRYAEREAISKIHTIDRDLLIRRASPLTVEISRRTAAARIALVFVSMLSIVGLALACGGLGIDLYRTVLMRRKAIGVCLALGATPRMLQSRILAVGLVIPLIGGCIGAAASRILLQPISGLLDGGLLNEGLGLFESSGILVVGSMLVALPAALLISRIHPADLLRAE